MHIKKWLLPSRRKKNPPEELWAYWPEYKEEGDGGSTQLRGRRGFKSRDELARHYGYGEPPRTRDEDDDQVVEADIFGDILGAPLLAGGPPRPNVAKGRKRSWESTSGRSTRSGESSRRVSFADTWEKLIPRRRTYYRMEGL